MKITIIGTGYVGLVTGICLADAGFAVVCMDKEASKIAKLQKAETPFFEPRIGEMIVKNKKNITFTTQIPSESSIIFICVGTPPQPDGKPNMTAYWQVVDGLSSHIANVTVPMSHNTPPLSHYSQENGSTFPGSEEKQKRMLVINKSTVPVGTARQAQKKLGDSVQVISMPEFLREGKAVYDFQHPNRIVLGSQDGNIPQPMHTILSNFSSKIIGMSWESAELTKYAANAFLATKISFINELAQLSEKIGAHIDDIAKGIGMDPRIGESFLQAGIGYGGSCFPKDVHALASLAGEHNYPFQLLKATIEVNNNQRRFVLEKIIASLYENRTEPHLYTDKKIAILGTAFKNDTDDIRESAAIFLIEELLKKGCKVSCFDPQAIENTKSYFANSSITPQFCDTIEACIEHAHCLVIATEWEEFKTLDWTHLKSRAHNPMIVDAKNLLNHQEMINIGWQYIGIGRL